MADELICEACGEVNRAGSTFCLACRTYLGWQAPRPAPSTTSAGTAPTSPTTPVDPEADTPRDTAVRVAAGRRTRVSAPPRSTVPSGVRCASCRYDNPPGRRFCTKCGHQLAGRGAAGRPVASKPTGFRAWWNRRFDSRDRAARKAYRRSLPPLYRWRRVGVVVAVAVLVVAGVVVSGGRPVQWATSRWYDLTNRTEVVRGIVPSVQPAKATVRGSDASRLTDGDVAGWTSAWSPRSKAAGCGAPRGTATVVLDFSPRALRRINVWAGLPKDDQDRRLQARPKRLLVDLGEGRCVGHTLADTPDMQGVAIPAGPPVGRIRLAVAEAYQTKGGKPQLTFTEIQLLAQPG